MRFLKTLQKKKGKIDRVLFGTLTHQYIQTWVVLCCYPVSLELDFFFLDHLKFHFDLKLRFENCQIQI